MSKTFFPGGIHLHDKKERTKNCPIELMPDPEIAIIPLSQHLGKPSKPLVQVGDKVKIGQLIGEAQGNYSANIHASISGEVIKVSLHPHPSNIEDLAVFIQNDHQSEWFQPPQPNEQNLLFKKEELIELVRQHGIVGMGGATFPTHIKLDTTGKEVDTLLINGAECEPYLTCDYRLMIEQTDLFIGGLKILTTILPVKKILIGIEENKQDAILHIRREIQNSNLSVPTEVYSLKEKYPQGAEKNLIFALTRRTVPVGKLPFDVGIIVHNISTVIAIYEAIYLQKPLIERVLTISGEGIANPKNVKVKIGTPVKDIIQYCQGDTDNSLKVIFGGPMMGVSVRSLETPVMKGTSGVLVFHSKAPFIEKQCIRCGTCIQNCPSGLMPVKITEASKVNEILLYEKLFVASCVECGICSYNCPASIPLLNYIRLAKAELLKRRN